MFRVTLSSVLLIVVDLAVVASLTTRCCHKAVLSCCDSRVSMSTERGRERERVGESGRGRGSLWKRATCEVLSNTEGSSGAAGRE